jgi:hypothetical protein
MRFFFLVGCPRSGTTMLQQALNRHSQVVIPPETSFFFLPGFPPRDQRRHLARICSYLAIDLPFPRGDLNEPPVLRALYRHMAERYLQRLGRSDVALFGEKSPEHLLRLADIFRIYPEAKVILIYRDGRDVALSLTQAPFLFADLDLNFAYWLHYCRQQLPWLRTPHANLYVVKYEDLVRTPDIKLAKVLAFLDLGYEANVAHGWGNREGILDIELGWKGRACSPIDASRIGRWREELSAGEIARLERWGGETLRSLGYDLLTSGMEPLPRLFFPRLYARMLLWLAKQPHSRMAREAVRQGWSTVSGRLRGLRLGRSVPAEGRAAGVSPI